MIFSDSWQQIRLGFQSYSEHLKINQNLLKSPPEPHNKKYTHDLESNTCIYI